MPARFSLPSRVLNSLVATIERESGELPKGRSRKLVDRFDPPCLEDRFRQRGFSVLVGVDEAGRGPLAGPVVAAAVEFPEGVVPPGIRDSKKLSARARLRLFPRIRGQAVAVGIGVVTAEGIDEWNIRVATAVAMARAVRAMGREPDWVFLDGVRQDPFPYRQVAVVGGDDRVPSIAAASIVAKVARDRLMASYHRILPVYRFDKHKAYPTQEHAEAIRSHGASSIHRKSFHVPGGGDEWTGERSAGEAKSTPRAT